MLTGYIPMTMLAIKSTLREAAVPHSARLLSSLSLRRWRNSFFFLFFVSGPPSSGPSDASYTRAQKRSFGFWSCF